MSIKVIQAICDLGVVTNGASLGAKEAKNLIKDRQILENISTLTCTYDTKSKDKRDKAKNIDDINIFNKNLYNEVLRAKQSNFIPLVIGGDHSISIASALASIQYEKDMRVIWIDAHTDFNTFDSTPSGNVHGMPLATITKNNGYNLTKFHNGNYYRNENTVVIGARDIDKTEMEILKKCGIKFFSTQEVNDNFESVIQDSLNIALNNTMGVHISIDIDVIDPLIAPGVSVPVKNGISYHKLIEILNHILQFKDKVKSIDIVEFNPNRDQDQKTRRILEDLINYFILQDL